MMIELASQGKTVTDIANVLKQVPIHPRIIAAIKSAHAAGYIFICLSISYSSNFNQNIRNYFTNMKLDALIIYLFFCVRKLLKKKQV